MTVSVREFKAGGDIDDTGADGDDGSVAVLFLVLEVDADDAAFEDAEALDGIEMGGAPMADVGGDSEAGVATFNEAADVEGVPDFVIHSFRRKPASPGCR